MGHMLARCACTGFGNMWPSMFGVLQVLCQGAYLTKPVQFPMQLSLTAYVNPTL